MTPGSVITVMGPVPPAELGITLIHEHVFVDITCYYSPPEDREGRCFASQPVRIGNLGWLRQNSMRSLANLRLDDARKAISELKRFRRSGGGTVVDQTSIGIARNPVGLREVAQATGLHIVAGSGYYIASSHPAGLASRTRGEIAREIIRDVREGIGETGIRAGIIGEIGTSWPVHPDEEKVLRAAGMAQGETGAPLSVHPGPSRGAPQHTLAILREEGVNPRRVIMSHIEARYRAVLDDYRSLADTGCNLAFDTFGREQYFAALGRQHPQDDLRIDIIAELARLGYAKQILLSQDVCYRSDWFRYGGHGYAHVLQNIVPRMESRGVSPGDIQTMVVDNPRALLAIA